MFERSLWPRQIHSEAPAAKHSLFVNIMVIKGGTEIESPTTRPGNFTTRRRR